MEIDVFSILSIAVIIGLIPAVIAAKKGHNFLAWWIFGTLIWIVALPMAIIIKPDQKILEQKKLEQGMKKCPYCAEIIKGEAKVCRYCGREVPLIETKEKALDERDSSYVTSSANEQSPPSQFRPKIRFVNILLIVWFLINLYLLGGDIKIDITPYFSSANLTILKFIFIGFPVIAALWIAISIFKHNIKKMPLFIFLALMSIAAIFFPVGPSYEMKFLELNAKVSYDGANINVTNNDSFDWNNVTVKINGENTFPDSWVTDFSIKSGQSSSIGVWQFKDKNEKYIDRNKTKPADISIACSIADKKRGRYYGKVTVGGKTPTSTAEAGDKTPKH